MFSKLISEAENWLLSRHISSCEQKRSSKNEEKHNYTVSKNSMIHFIRCHIFQQEIISESRMPPKLEFQPNILTLKLTSFPAHKSVIRWQVWLQHEIRNKKFDKAVRCIPKILQQNVLAHNTFLPASLFAYCIFVIQCWSIKKLFFQFMKAGPLNRFLHRSPED